MLEQFKPTGRDEEFEWLALRTRVLGEFAAAVRAALADLDQRQAGLMHDEPVRYAHWLEGQAAEEVGARLRTTVDKLPAPIGEEFTRWKASRQERARIALPEQGRGIQVTTGTSVLPFAEGEHLLTQHTLRAPSRRRLPRVDGPSRESDQGGE